MKTKRFDEIFKVSQTDPFNKVHKNVDFIKGLLHKIYYGRGRESFY